jgi:hypothetical protein
VPTNRPKRSKRMTGRDVEDDILATAHGLASALHRVGAMDEPSLRSMDRLCILSERDYDGAEVRRIRAATRMSQPVFARFWAWKSRRSRNGNVVRKGHRAQSKDCWRCWIPTSRTARSSNSTASSRLAPSSRIARSPIWIANGKPWTRSACERAGRRRGHRSAARPRAHRRN